jgi:hypothetical protein
MNLVPHFSPKASYVQAQAFGMKLEVIVLELMLTLEENVVHLPEPSLGSRRLGCLGRPLREWMHVVTREVAKDEANLPRYLFQEFLDGVVGAAAIRAFELAILDERYASIRITSDVVCIGDRSDESLNLLNGSHFASFHS